MIRRLAVALLVATAPAFAQVPSAPADAGPLAVVEALFDAMAAHDAGAARALIAPGARLLVVHPDGSVHAGSDEGFIAAIGKDAASWQERQWNPQVRVDGPMAHVWAPYDFHRDGELSHCGTNSISLVRGEAGWRIVEVTYTMRREDCQRGAGDADE